MAPTVKMSTSNNDQDQVEDRSRFRRNDIELLKTGQFSDVQVVVGDLIWNVHRSIVCLRSSFFKKKSKTAPVSELLDMGKSSNARVIVGSRVWSVHKSTVCLRSGFSRKTLSGPSKAEGVNAVHIRNHTERQVEMLVFIYSRQ